MTKTKIAEKFLISMPIFGVEVNEENGKHLLHHCSILNYGDDLGSGIIKYINKDGVQVMPTSSFPTCIKVFKIEQIDLDHLMRSWKKETNCYLPVVLDETIEVGEVYKNRFSPVSIMIERREKETAIKLLFND